MIFPSVRPVEKVSLWKTVWKNPIYDDHIGFPEFSWSDSGYQKRNSGHIEIVLN